MKLKYNLDIDEVIIKQSLKKIINQTYKLLPMREQGSNWQKPLTTIIEQLVGLNRLLVSKQKDLFSAICKLEGLFQLVEEDDFLLYRRTIFEVLSLLNGMS